MNVRSHIVSDPRINNALEVIIEFSRGNFKAQGRISEQYDEIDALITGSNMLGEEREAYIAERRKMGNWKIDLLYEYAVTREENASANIYGYNGKYIITQQVVGLTAAYRF